MTLPTWLRQRRRADGEPTTRELIEAFCDPRKAARLERRYGFTFAAREDSAPHRWGRPTRARPSHAA